MTKLNCLKGKDWQNLKDIIIFGFGRQGIKMYSTLSRDFNIVGLVDNSPDKQGKTFDGHTIHSFDQAKNLCRDHKIIVTASQYYYQDIRKQLENFGLVENDDFVMYQQFVTEWYYKYKKKINVIKTDIPLTSHCTLKCRHCMQFLPFWKEKYRKETPLDEIFENIDIYFKCVDYVLDLDVVGGEPFLYTYLDKFITYIGENYRDRIGYIGIITNGTIVPNRQIFELIKKYSIDVSITDYSQNIPYRHKVDDLCDKLNKYGIKYMRNINIDWFDFGFPEKKYNYDDGEVKAHMERCNTIVHILDDKKLFYCGMEWSAQKGGLFPSEERTYIELEDVYAGRKNKKAILEMVMGNIPGGYMEFCKKCGGFGIDNNNRVGVAQQMKSKVDV